MSGVGLDHVVDNPIAAAVAGATALLVAFAVSTVTSWLIAALAGGAAYAAACLLLAERPSDAAAWTKPWPIANALKRHGYAFAIVFAAVFLASQASDAPKAFFCASAVAWSPAIFAGGVYVLAVLSELGRRQNKSGLVHVVWVGIAWIAPWDRSVSDYALLAVFGAAASIAGTFIGRWLADGLPTRPINPYQDL